MGSDLTGTWGMGVAEGSWWSGIVIGFAGLGLLLIDNDKRRRRLGLHDG